MSRRSPFGGGSATAGSVASALSPILAGINGFRLTLTSGTPVTTADVTGATNIYVTPYTSNAIALYGSSEWGLYSSSEITFALGTLSNNTNYDLFAYASGSTVAVEALAWSSDTARATALTMQDGVYVKNGAPTRRYLGTFRTTSTTTTEDSVSKRFVFNAANRVPRVMKTSENTSWLYQSATIRQARGSTANKVELVDGLGVALVTSSIQSMVEANSGVSVQAARIGHGLDTTTAFTTNSATWSATFGGIAGAGVGKWNLVQANLTGYVGTGYHYISWNEQTDATGSTYYSAAGGVLEYPGISAVVDM